MTWYTAIGFRDSGKIPLVTTAENFSVRQAQKVVFDGDSLTSGSPDATYAWVVPFQASMSANFTGAGLTIPTYANVAVGGNTTTEMLAAVANVTAQNPDHVFVLCGINDQFNHGGTPIPPATTQSNYTSYFATIKAARPNVRFHCIANLWFGNENWPDGAGVGDTNTNATNAGIRAAVALESSAEYFDIRTPIYSIDAPLHNPSHATSGVLTQEGTHPTKTEGQVVIAQRVWKCTTLGI